MKKVKLFSKFLAAVTAVSMLSVPVYAGNEPAPFVSDDYGISAEGFDCTFKELLEMDNEEFLELDKYKGEYPADCMPMNSTYLYCMQVINAVSERFDRDVVENVLGHAVSDTLEEELENLKQDLSVLFDNEAVAVMPWYSCAGEMLGETEEYYPTGVVSIENLSDTFVMNATTDLVNNTKENGNAEYNQEIDPVWLAKKLNEYLGDEVDYTCFEELNWKTQEPTGRLFIKFDMADKLDVSEENVIYSAKLLSCLSRINSGAVAVNNDDYQPTDETIVFDSAVKVGDADGDSAVTVRDCVEIAGRLSMQDNSFSEWVDYNLDEKVNVRDAAAIAGDLAVK